MAKSYKEDNRPSLQFYPDDWLTEAGLRLCSLEARGLWMDMLCWMFKAQNRGALLSNHKQITSKDLAKLEGIDEQIINKLLKELEEHRVLSRLKNKTIINRRMYYKNQRQNEIKEARAEAGRLGGQAKDKQKPIKPPSKRQAKSTAPSPSPSPSLKRKALSGKPDLEAPVLYLNKRANRNFDSKNKSSQNYIKARYNEGRTLEQFKIVIDKKTSDWKNDEKMFKYLRPSTLFNRTNFENYINEPRKTQKTEATCIKHPGIVLKNGKCFQCELEKDN